MSLGPSQRKGVHLVNADADLHDSYSFGGERGTKFHRSHQQITVDRSESEVILQNGGALDSPRPGSRVRVLSILGNDEEDKNMSDVSPKSRISKRKASVRRSEMDVVNKALGVEETEPLDMWRAEYIGLYAHYAMTGLLLGLVGRPSVQACRAGYFKEDNVSSEELAFFCDNLSGLALIPWNLKFFYSILTDTIWPFGYRRKPYMVFGWVASIALLIFISFNLDNLTPPQYAYWLLCVMVVFQFANVAADGYCVQLALTGHDGSVAMRGSILVTGQIVRFGAGVVSNFFHGFLLNGKELNPGAPISWNQAWSWSISLQAYYLTITAFLILLLVPLLRLKEVKDEHVERRSVFELFSELWKIMHSKAVHYLLTFGVLINAFARVTNFTWTRLQYSILKIPIVLDGVEGMVAMCALTLGVLAFKHHLMFENWRKLHLYNRLAYVFYTTAFWIVAYHNIFGLRNGWFTVFIVVTSQFFSGITQTLLSVAIIEIARPGMEASVYQLVVSVVNSSITISRIIGNQLYGLVIDNKVDTSSLSSFDKTDGPWIFTWYSLILALISTIFVVISSRFVPEDRSKIHYWDRQARFGRWNCSGGYVTLAISGFFVLYGLCISVIYFFPNLSCHPFFGGGGCEST